MIFRIAKRAGRGMMGGGTGGIIGRSRLVNCQLMHSQGQFEIRWSETMRGRLPPDKLHGKQVVCWQPFVGCHGR